VLFWNIQKQPLLHRVARIAASQAVDIVLLTECVQTDAELMAALNVGGKGPFRCPRRVNKRFRVASRMPVLHFPEVFNDTSGRLTFHELRTPSRPELLIGLVHLPSPAEWENPADRFAFAQTVAGGLRAFEQTHGNSQTLVIGDFNLNPFDDVMVGVFGFHALMTRELTVRRDSRVVKGYDGPAFFNPMWQFLTDRGSQPAGTLYFHDSRPINHYWYTPDQVLVRSEIADRLVSVHLLETDGTDTLLDQKHGWPDSVNGSDHLPLLIQVNW
jgi:hypothetical protein